MELINCNLQPLPARNSVFDGCCCEIACEIALQGGESSRNVNTINLNVPIGSGSSIVSVDGTPYTTPASGLPFTISGSTNLVIVFEICAPAGIGSVEFIDLVITWTNAGGGTQTISFSIDTVSQTLFFAPFVADTNFGTVVLGSSVQQSYNFTNPTICDAEISFSQTSGPGVGCSEVTLNQTSPFTVPPLTVAPIVIDWSPVTSGALDCTVEFDICGTLIPTILTGLTAAFDDCINCTNLTIETENNYLTAAPGLCDDYPAGNYYGNAAIGEKKKVIFDFYYVIGLTAGFELWFNPELFGDVCDFASKYPSGTIDSAPPAAYYVEFFPGIGTAAMTFVGGLSGTNSQKNYSVNFIEGASATEFSVEFEFYMTQDVDNWLNPSILQNNNRLLRNSIFSPANLTNSTPSIYNQIRRSCFLFYCLDPSVLVTDPLSGTLVPFTCSETLSVRNSARFYAKGLFDGPSEMTNPIFTLTRGGVPVSDLSTLSETSVEFNIDAPAAVSTCVFWLIDASGVDNSIDFLDNYDTSRAAITTNPLPAVIDNHLKSPSTFPTNTGGITYQTTAQIDSNVLIGQSFYLIAIPYVLAEGYELVNSFISGPYPVTNLPSSGDTCCPVDVKNFFQGYNRTFENDCFLPTMKERIETRISIKGGLFESTCLPALGWVRPGGEWIDLVKSLDLLVYREEIDFPSVGQTTSFTFGTYRSERTAGFPGNWNNLNPPFVVADGGALELPEPKIQTNFETRVRYESGLLPNSVLIANNASKFTRGNAGPLASTYISTVGASFNWANEEIFFEYQLTFDLEPVLGTPFTTIQVFRSKIIPFDFEGDSPRGLDEIKFFYPNIVDPNLPGEEVFGPFCSNQVDTIFVRVHKNRVEDMNLIATVDFSPFGVGNLEEEESYSSTALIPLTQLSSDTMFDVDSVFDNGTGFAFYKLDLFEFGIGEFQICGIGKIIVQ
jgi:hypothetical protein